MYTSFVMSHNYKSFIITFIPVDIIIVVTESLVY